MHYPEGPLFPLIAPVARWLWNPHETSHSDGSKWTKLSSLGCPWSWPVWIPRSVCAEAACGVGLPHLSLQLVLGAGTWSQLADVGLGKGRGKQEGSVLNAFLPSTHVKPTAKTTELVLDVSRFWLWVTYPSLRTMHQVLPGVTPGIGGLLTDLPCCEHWAHTQVYFFLYNMHISSAIPHGIISHSWHVIPLC